MKVRARKTRAGTLQPCARETASPLKSQEHVPPRLWSEDQRGGRRGGVGPKVGRLLWWHNFRSVGCCGGTDLTCRRRAARCDCREVAHLGPQNRSVVTAVDGGGEEWWRQWWRRKQRRKRRRKRRRRQRWKAPTAREVSWVARSLTVSEHFPRSATSYTIFVWG